MTACPTSNFRVARQSVAPCVVSDCHAVSMVFVRIPLHFCQMMSIRCMSVSKYKYVLILTCEPSGNEPLWSQKTVNVTLLAD